MSSLNTEPHAFGHIEIKTTFGDLDVELFTQQCPKATKNFVQNCVDGRYINTIFDRVEKDFIAIGGSLPGKPASDEDEYFPDEFHSRLRFNRRGLLATANTSKNKNGAKFFFTLGPTPELQGKHTIFGRVKGNAVYTLVELNDCQVDDEFRPCSEQRILDVTVKENPLPNVIPRESQLIQHHQRLLEEESSDSDVDSDDDPLRRRRPSALTNKKLSFHPESESESDDSNDAPLSTDPESGRTQSPETKNDLISGSGPAQCESEKSSQNSEEKSQVSSKKPIDKEQRLKEIRAQIQKIKQQIERTSEVKSEPEKRSTDTNEDESDSTIKVTERELASKSSKVSKSKTHDERYTMEVVGNFRRHLKETVEVVSESEDRTKRRKKSEKNLDDLDDELAALNSLDDEAWLRHKFIADEDRI